jgi:hypothetical protein
MKKKYRNIKLIVYKRKKARHNKRKYQKNYFRSDLVELYKAQVLDYNKTRDIQWRFNISIWTLLGIVILFKYIEPDIFDSSLVTILFLIALLAHYMFIYIIQRSLAGSKRIMDKYIQHLNHYNETAKININNRKYEKIYVLTLTDYLWIAFQIIITFFILLVFLEV